MYINSLAFPFIKAKKEKLYILYLCFKRNRSKYMVFQRQEKLAFYILYYKKESKFRPQMQKADQLTTHRSNDKTVKWIKLQLLTWKDLQHWLRNWTRFWFLVLSQIFQFEWLTIISPEHWKWYWMILAFLAPLQTFYIWLQNWRLKQ